MEALIYSPYLDTLGGGEGYTLSVAEYLLMRKIKVVLAWQSGDVKKRAKEILNIDVKKAQVEPQVYNLLKNKKNLLKRYKKLKSYDLIFFVSDGSIPFLFGKKNLVHFQVPFLNVGGRSLVNRLKLNLVDRVICNSKFTKKFIDKEFAVNSTVLYPPFSGEFRPAKKENIILSVGRFDNLGHPKKQYIMLKLFKALMKKGGLKSWQLVLAGGILNANNYIERLKSKARGFPVRIETNLPFEELKKLYSKAKIYWHAAGYGEDLESYPETAEHFGIAVLEAMASGCLPIVFNGGGLPEIIKNEKNGFLFNRLSQLENLTLKFVNNENERGKIAQRAIARAKDFSKERFFKRLDEIIQ